MLVDYVAERSPSAVFHVDTPDSVVALTLDDGPHPTLTPRLLDTLARYEARATFFVVGEKVDGREAVLRRATAEGHELGNHLMTTFPSLLLGSGTFEQRLLQTDSLLSVFQDSLRWVRPASGWYSAEMAQAARRHGYRLALGSVYPNDAQNPFPSYHVRYILRHVEPGAVIVLHEGSEARRRILTVLHRVLPALKARGYQIVTLSDLMRHRTSREATR